MNHSSRPCGNLSDASLSPASVFCDSPDDAIVEVRRGGDGGLGIPAAGAFPVHAGDRSDFRQPAASWLFLRTRRRGLALDHDARFRVGSIAWDVPDAAATVAAVVQGVGAVADRIKQSRREALTVRTWTRRHGGKGIATVVSKSHLDGDRWQA
jgi:hypothetical protein